MNNAILPHTLAVFAVGSTLVYCYDLRCVYDTKTYYVQEEGKRTQRKEKKIYTALVFLLGTFVNSGFHPCGV